jgi:uncharacterized membrane protein YphA (DoxX/SURF4 family)
VRHPATGIVLRLALGALFIIAAVAKLLAGASTLNSYISTLNIAPPNISHTLAVALPYVEFVVGYCLTIGLLTRLAAGLGLALIIGFIYANILAIVRGIDGGCHCFGETLGFSHPVDLAINVLMAIAAVQAIWFDKRNGFLKLDTWLSSFVKNHDKKLNVKTSGN